MHRVGVAVGYAVPLSMYLVGPFSPLLQNTGTCVWPAVFSQASYGPLASAEEATRETTTAISASTIRIRQLRLNALPPSLQVGLSPRLVNRMR